MVLHAKKKKKQAAAAVDETGGKAVLEDLFYREADAIFDTIDANNDGEILYDELIANLTEKGYPADSIRSLFTALDKNADGAISKEEMRFAFSNYEISALYKAFGLGNKLEVGGSNNNNNNAESSDGGADSKEKVYDDAVSTIRSKAISDNNKYSAENLTQLADMIFDMIDTDASGEIDIEELRMHFADKDLDQNFASTCFRQVGNDSVANVNSVLKALDINEDGVISREEMRQGFQQYDPRVLSSSLGLNVSQTAEL